MSSGNHYPPQPAGEPFGGDQGWHGGDQQGAGQQGADQAGIPPQPDYGPGSGQGYDPNAGYGYGGQPAGPAYDPGQGYGPGQGYDSGQGYDAGQGYGYDQPTQQDHTQPGYGAEPVPAYSASGPAMHHAGSTPQPAPAPGYVAGQGGQAGQQPGKKKSKTPLILSLVAVGVVVLLVVIGAVVITSVNRSQYGPDTVAQKYLDALEAGDIDSANEIAQPTVPNGANEKLLDPKYAQNSEEKITDAQVQETTIEGDTATINASYSVGGQPYELVLNATKDGRQGIFFDNWVLGAPTLQTIALEIPLLEGVTVNGEGFEPESGRTEYAVHPGSYAVATPEGTYFQAGEDQVTVGFSPNDQPQAATMSVAVTPKDSFHEEVQKLVDDKIEECGENDTIANDGCPFNATKFRDPVTGTELSDDGVDGSVDYTVESKPTVVASMSDDLSAGSFYSSEPGAFTFTADSKEYGEDAWSSTGSYDINASGMINIDGDSLSIEFFEP